MPAHHFRFDETTERGVLHLYGTATIEFEHHDALREILVSLHQEGVLPEHEVERIMQAAFFRRVFLPCSPTPANRFNQATELAISALTGVVVVTGVSVCLFIAWLFPGQDEL